MMTHRPLLFLGSVLAAVAATASTAFAELALPGIFSDHMVLQQQKPIQVWGIADSEADVEVSFSGKKAKTKAAKDGGWTVELPKLAANAKGQSLTVKAGEDSKTFKDVLIGEVWIASGQSNMHWSVARALNPEKEIEAANHPQIRLFQATTKTSSAPLWDIANWGGWKACSPETISGFSAVGYYFGRNLHTELEVPVGIIQCSWGGTRCEAWTSREALLEEPAANEILVDWKVQTLLFDKERAETAYKERLVRWEEQIERIKERNASLKPGEKPIKVIRKPGMEADPALSRHHPSAIYNAMIVPITGYAIRGAIWYQGESNQDRAAQYAEIFPAMIKDWRAKWQDDFSFYFAQLANYRDPVEEAGIEHPWAELQWAQFLTAKGLKGTGMAVINDLGEAKNVHPKNKQDVGKRLARLALANDYGKKIVASGPLYKGMKIERNSIRIFFDHVGTGLKITKGQKLQHVAISGADRVWHWADAYIEGNTIVATSKKVKQPVAVRYAWAANPESANLANKEGLPASLFRTDAWPLLTQGLNAPFGSTPEPKKAEPIEIKAPAPAKTEAKKPATKPAAKSEDKKPEAKATPEKEQKTPEAKTSPKAEQKKPDAKVAPKSEEKSEPKAEKPRKGKGKGRTERAGGRGVNKKGEAPKK